MKKRNKSLYLYIIRVFAVIFVVDILLAGVMFYFLTNVNAGAGLGMGAGISRQNSVLEDGDYEKLNLKKYLGRGGYYEVVDQKGEILYQSRRKKNTYSKVILEYIPDINKDVDIEVFPFDDNGEDGYVLVRLQIMENGEGMRDVLVIDGNRNIRYSSYESGKRQLSKNELDYFLDASEVNSDQDYVLQKYAFTLHNGDKRYLLLHAPIGKGNTGRTIRIWTTAIVVGFAGAVLLSIVIAALLIMRKVRKPLKVLNQGISSYSGELYQKVDENTGVREFDNVLHTFNEMEERLTESDRQKRELESQRSQILADISHDLKTPITVINGYLEAMEDGLIPPEEEKKYLKIMSDKTDVLQQLINAFAEYSRLEHPDFHFVFQKGDLAEYVREYIAARYDELEIAGYHLDVDIPDEEVFAYFDQEQLKRVFENILSNTMKYTEAGTTIYVKMRIAEYGKPAGRSEKEDHSKGALMRTENGTGRVAFIDLGDNGPGMDESLKEQVFIPFVTGDVARRSGQGTGLGMSIAKKIVEGHKGSIRVLFKKEWKQGTMYEIMLPVI